MYTSNVYRTPFIPFGGKFSTQWRSIHLRAIVFFVTASVVTLRVIAAVRPSRRVSLTSQRDEWVNLPGAQAVTPHRFILYRHAGYRLDHCITTYIPPSDTAKCLHNGLGHLCIMQYTIIFIE